MNAEILKQFLNRKKARVGSYSLRALARDLGVSPAFISGVLNNRRVLPLRLIDRIGQILDIDSETLEKIRSECAMRSHARKKAPTHAPFRKPDWELVNRSEFKILRQWFYVAILDLTLCRDFRCTPKTVAQKLGLHETTAEIAIRDLTVAGLLVEKDGRFIKSKNYLKLVSSQSLSDIRNFHTQMLLKAQHELSNRTSEADFAKRLITGITITASEERIREAKAMLSDALFRIAEFLSAEQGDQVYHLAGQLFPLTDTVSESKRS